MLRHLFLILQKTPLNRNKYDKKFALTCNNWTATNQQAFIKITIHFLNKDWQLESKLLNMIDLKESHSENYMFRLLKNSLEEFKIEKNVIRLVKIQILIAQTLIIFLVLHSIM